MSESAPDNDPLRRRNPVRAIIFSAAFACIALPTCWRIARKAGYDPRLALWMIVSPVNLWLLVRFATSEWPIERELRQLKEAPSAADDGAGRTPLSQT